MKISAEDTSKLTFNNSYLTSATIIQPPEPSISFLGANQEPIIKLSPNGDIFVHGKLVENDKEVVDGMRSLLSGIDSYWKKKYEELCK